jgi:RluA family pseudouridine synthase
LKDTLLSVYSREFLAHSKSYYELAIKEGRITVNKEHVTCDYILRDNDRIVHKLTRHETPVYKTDRIEVLYEDKDMIAVDKPPSMPVHEGGNYRYNTVIGILEEEQGYKGLKCVHRLDK